MIRCIVKAAGFLCLYLSMVAHAADYSGGWVLNANAHLNRLAIETDKDSPDIDPNYAVDINAGYYFNRWIAVEGGAYAASSAITTPASDIVSSYQVTIDSDGLTLGFKPTWRINKQHELALRIGVFYWRSELTVEESFGGDVTPGTSTDSDSGLGTYMHIAWHYWFNQHWAFNTQLSSYQQNDLFKDDSNKSFGLTSKALSLGGVYKF